LSGKRREELQREYRGEGKNRKSKRGELWGESIEILLCNLKVRGEGRKVTI